MRTVNFRDGVLWELARKIGLDPEDNLFLTNEALALVTFINAWVGKMYDAEDFGELTKTERRVPVSHVVGYGNDPLLAPPDVNATPIGRMLKAYLLDPATTRWPVDTPYRLTENGVHVGFEHGPYVWLKFMPPAPTFTGDPWDSSRTYSKGELTYSPRSGECYTSKTNNNRGNDPSGGRTEQRELTTELLQLAVLDDPGLPATQEVLAIGFIGLSVPPDPPNVPASGSIFHIIIQDGDGNILGDSFHTADGVETLGDVITAMATALDAALPVSFTVTPDTVNKVITIQAPSYFTAGIAFYEQFTPEFIYHPLRTKTEQTYIPAVAAAAGSPQITQLTMVPDDAVPGAEYTLIFTDQSSVQHTLSYTAATTDVTGQVLAGIAAALDSSTDVFFDKVSFRVDPTTGILTITMRQIASIDVTMRPPGSTYWNLVPFPFVIAQAVVRGARADYLRENRQDDTAAQEEQAVPAELGIRVKAATNRQYDPLSDQQRSKSRYAVR